MVIKSVGLCERLSCAEDRESSPHARLANQAIDTGWKQARLKTHTHMPRHTVSTTTEAKQRKTRKSKGNKQDPRHTHTCHDTRLQQQQKPNKEKCVQPLSLSGNKQDSHTHNTHSCKKLCAVIVSLWSMCYYAGN